MSTSRSDLALRAALLLPFALLTAAKKAKLPSDYAPSVAEPAPPPLLRSAGAIFPGESYAPLTSGARASMVGDVITIVLVESTQAAKTSAAKTDRNGNIGLNLPTAGPLALAASAASNMSGGGKFDGNGQSSQSNTLTGAITVTVAQVYANGTMLVRGEKTLTLNRGDENIHISGIVRAADIGPDNSILSTRVADAKISYSGTGDIARASKPGWLQHFFSILSPF